MVYILSKYPAKPILKKVESEFELEAAAVLRGTFPSYRFEKQVTIKITSGRIASINPSTKNISTSRGGEQLLLLPAFTNPHTHLELSILKNRMPEKSGMAGFIKSVVAHKANDSEANKIARMQAIEESIQDLLYSGTLLIGDISNNLEHIGILNNSILQGIIFYELLGLGNNRADKIWENAMYQLETASKQVNSERWKISLSAHSPYSLSQRLMQRFAQYRRNIPDLASCAHVLESVQERDYLDGRVSPMAEYLQTLPFGDPLFPWKDFFSLFLDACTFFVHGVELSDREMDAIARQEIAVVLCPRSNLFIHESKSDAAKMKKKGIKLALATDSLASNRNLNMFSEMQAALDLYSLPPSEIFYMSTAAGAELLGRGRDVGFLEPGYLPAWLAFDLDKLEEEIGLLEKADLEKIFSVLIQKGQYLLRKVFH